MASGRPAIAAMPTAIMAPEISPPGRFAHKNSAPPAVPITSVSSTLRVLARLGMATASDAGIWLTAPYGKSLHRGQMRQRDCSNACPCTPTPSRHAPRMRGIQYHEALQLNYNGRGLAVVPRHFALSADVFLHSDMNFLRSLPWRLLVSASFEHSSDAAVRGLAAFFSAGAIFVAGSAFAGAVLAAGAGVVGAVVCA